ncbi:MAG: NADH-quinone oxidoreductase subunit B [Candidatus Coatesbacteria bacterium]|nr:MAG: NADH-quinone oxidoreductase subunit B [Candidatus Coatesbacteria bacterium]
MGVIARLPVYWEKLPGGGLVTTSVEKVLNWSRASSIWYMIFGLACCAIEMMAAGASRYDFDRYGMMFRATPRQSDMMFISGTITLKMAPRIRRLWEQLAEPRYVVAMGSCAISGGGFFYDAYSVLKGIDKIIPVDVYVPGCPPRPEALMHGCLKLQEKIKREGLVEAFGDFKEGQAEAERLAGRWILDRLAQR